MVKELVAEYVFKRKKVLNISLLFYYRNYKPTGYILAKLNKQDLDVIKIVKEMSYNDYSQVMLMVDKLYWAFRDKQQKIARKAYNKKKLKMKESGDKFKDEIETGYVIEVIMAGGQKGLMYVMAKLDDTFLGQYVYKKMDMGLGIYKRRPGTVTEKMYKFITRIINKEVTLA